MTDNRLNTIAYKNTQLAEMFQPLQNEVLVRFVHFSDTHLSADPQYTHDEADYTPMEGARALVNEINRLPFSPDFVLHTGDVTFDPVESAYHAAREILSQIRFPTYYLVGNHDDRLALQKVLLGVVAPRTPYYYEFEVNGVQIICLDSNGPAPYAGGVVSEDQMAWLGDRCRTPDVRPLVVAVHHNVLPIGAPFWDTFMRMTNGETFHQTLLPAQKRLRGVFFGHVHQPTEMVRDGILYSSVPSTWYQLHCYPGQADIHADRLAEPGFSVVTITRTQTFIRRHRFHVPAMERSRLRRVNEANIPS